MKYVLLLILFQLAGCSTYVVNTAKYSEFITEEYSRSKVLDVLGEPANTGGTNQNRMDTFIVEGRVFDSATHQMTKAGWEMTLGLSELALFPASLYTVISEAICPKQKQLTVEYYNDVSIFQTTSEYQPHNRVAEGI